MFRRLRVRVFDGFKHMRREAERKSPPVFRIGAPLSEVVACAAEARNMEAERIAEVLMPEYIVDRRTKRSDEAVICRLAQFRQQATCDIHSVGEFAGIVQIGIAGEPDLLTLDDAAQTRRVRVVIERLCYARCGVLGSQLLR